MSDFTKLKRTEDKYILSKSQAAKIQKLVEEKMAPSYPNPTTTFTLIKSTYLDSPDAKAYQDHVNKKKDRCKIRIRTYGNNGSWATKEAYLEEKETHQGGDKKKQRARLWDDDNTDFLNGESKDFVDSVHKKVSKEDLKPVCVVSYSRQAYQDPDGFRVTFDSDIEYTKLGETISIPKSDLDMIRALDIGTKYDVEKDVVMEVKHNGEPGWFKELLEKEGIQHTSFSKYSYSMYHLIKFT